jgi:hypothetical protein
MTVPRQSGRGRESAEDTMSQSQAQVNILNATADDGRTFQIHVFTDAPATPRGQKVPGGRRYRTVDGEAVRLVAPGRFAVFTADGEVEATTTDPISLP